MAEWISVKDRLPEKRDRYLCLSSLKYNGGEIPWHMILWFTNKAEDNADLAYNGAKGAAWYRNDSEWGSCKVDDVTHWMPLPEPPKESKRWRIKRFTLVTIVEKYLTKRRTG